MSAIFGRRVLKLIGASLVASTPISALAADYLEPLPELRGAYEEEWGFSNEPDPINIEAGIRYSYSMGSHGLTAFGGNYSSADTSHIMEVHARVEDDSTATYLKGYAGYAAAIEGTYTTPEFGGAQTMNGGQIGYGVADFGYTPYDIGNIQFGGFAGYQYLVDTPDMGRATYATAGGGGASEVNLHEIHALRMGVTAGGDVNEWFDFQAEATAIPYANLSGTYGAFYQSPFLSGGDTFEQGSAASINGSLYGAAGELMLGFHPTENIAIRIGGRAQYLTGSGTMEFTAREDGTPANSVDYIGDVTNLEFIRYGLMAELTAQF